MQQQWRQTLSFLFFTVLNLGDCAVVLQCGEVCLEDVAQYTCTNDGAISLVWTVPNPQNSQETDMLSITKFTNSNLTDDTDTFTAVLTDDDPFVSTLSFVTTNQLNNKDIVCLSGGNSKTCTIMILGSPSVPLNTSVTAIGPNTVVVSWSPPLNSSQCIDHYVVNIISENSQNTTNSYTTLVINQLIQGMNYSFSVTGVDRAERSGEESETAKMTLDVPESVIDLNFTLTDDESFNLMITWKPPIFSLTPPVIDYHVYHNITSSDGSLVHNVTNNMTHITFTSVSSGSQYIVNVTAENIIGIGEESLINVLVSSTSPNNVVTDVLKATTITVFTTLSEMSSSYYSYSSSNTPETTHSSNSIDISALVPAVASVFGLIIALLAVFVCLTVFIVYKRQSGKHKLTASTELSSNKDKRNLSSEPGFNFNGTDQTESTLGPTYAAVIKKPQPTPLSQYDEVPPLVPPYNYNDEPPKIPPYMGGDEPPPLRPSGGEYSVLQREERNQKENEPEKPPLGLYSTINQRKDEPFVLEPSGKEYSVLRRSEREQRERETNPQLESSGSGQYSVLKQNMGDKKTGTGGIIYADLGAAPKNRPIIPPSSGFSEPVVYSSITKPPPVPKRLSQKKKDMIYAQLQLELPPSVTPPLPSVNIQQEKVIYSSVNKQL